MQKLNTLTVIIRPDHKSNAIAGKVYTVLLDQGAYRVAGPFLLWLDESDFDVIA